MNGVRRYFGGGTGSAAATPSSQSVPLPSASPPPAQSTSIAPLSVASKSSWPPSSQVPAEAESPKTTTAALFFRKDRQRPPQMPSGSAKSDEDSSFQSSRDSMGSSPARSSTQLSSPVAGPSSPRMPMPHRVVELARKPVDPSGVEGKRTSGMLSTRDDLLLSLLASEAIVESRGCEVLSAEEVEELKKEYQVLSSRIVAMSKKLTLETKIRDAALSLSKANASYKNVTKQTSDQVEAANRKVELAQKEYWRVSERANEIQRKLLEHRAGVLSYSVRSMEKKNAPPDSLMENGDSSTSGYSTPGRSSQMSPTPSSVTSVNTTSSKGRFDGAHFFAGHSDAIVPHVPRLPPSSAEISSLEEKLKVLTDALEAANAKQAETAKELSMLRMEKEQAETSMSLELQTAEDTVASLERKISRMEDLDAQLRALEEEKRSWTQDRAELEERREEAEALESQLDQTQKELEMMQRRTEVLAQQRRDSADIQGLLMREKEENRAQLEAQADELAEAKASWVAERAAWDAERETLQAGGVAKVQLDKGADALQDLMQSFGILLFSRDTSIVGLVTSIRKHLEELHSKMDAHTRAQDEWNAARAKMEEDIHLGLDKRQALVEEVEEARRARDAANAETRSLDAQLKEISMARAATLEAETQPVVEYTGDAAKIVAALQPVWAILPSPEARAGKLGSRNFRPASPASPIMTRGGGGSLSEMDVRSLKTLYDPKGFPISSKTGAGGAFSVEAFVSRVQALIADDRALIERLIRFAQAHDLLKKNAERAQKLAQESNAALETYQKQVKMLEESNMVSMAKQAALQDEVQNLQDAVERITAEKLEVETHAAEQGETCRQLTDANNKLSARALTLAEEAASASDGVRKQMEMQLSECRESLARAQQQIEEITVSQQSQQMALLEELNSVQTENTNLRTQLRKK